MLELERRHKARGLRVVSVAREDDSARVAEVAKEEGMTYPCFLDADGAWSKAADAKSIPLFLVVDRQGKLAYRHSGRLLAGSAGLERLEKVLEQALAAQGG